MRRGHWTLTRSLRGRIFARTPIAELGPLSEAGEQHLSVVRERLEHSERRAPLFTIAEPASLSLLWRPCAYANVIPFLAFCPALFSPRKSPGQREVVSRLGDILGIPFDLLLLLFVCAYALFSFSLLMLPQRAVQAVLRCRRGPLVERRLRAGLVALTPPPAQGLLLLPMAFRISCRGGAGNGARTGSDDCLLCGHPFFFFFHPCSPVCRYLSVWSGCAELGAVPAGAVFLYCSVRLRERLVLGESPAACPV